MNRNRKDALVKMPMKDKGGEMWKKYGEFSDHKADLTNITVRGKEGVLGRKSLGQLCSNTKSSIGWMRKFLLQISCGRMPQCAGRGNSNQKHIEIPPHTG